MEFRLGDRARATRDLDLALRGAVEEAHQVRDLLIESLAGDPDHDGFEFAVGRASALAADEAGRPGWWFTVDVRLAARRFAIVRLDVVARRDQIAGTERVPLPGMVAFAYRFVHRGRRAKPHPGPPAWTSAISFPCVAGAQDLGLHATSWGLVGPYLSASEIRRARQSPSTLAPAAPPLRLPDGSPSGTRGARLRATGRPNETLAARGYGRPSPPEGEEPEGWTPRVPLALAGPGAVRQRVPRVPEGRSRPAEGEWIGW